jgi:serine protease Do
LRYPPEAVCCVLTGKHSSWPITASEKEGLALIDVFPKVLHRDFFTLGYLIHFARAAVLGLALVSANSSYATIATDLFVESQQLVYQIRVIDIASGDKYSIGSGFLVGATGNAVTNFHVVSSYVHEPDKYRLEFVRSDDSVAPLNLLAIDVVHDLALVHTGEPEAEVLPLATESLAQGDRIYSLGNPHDLGMTIIEGTYNGLVENSRYKKILFSGSLNAGMSGGPTLNDSGEVVGVNVSKGGEQISFLVPVEHVHTLLAQNDSFTGTRDFEAEITATLLADQQQFYQGLLDQEVTVKPMGHLQVAGKLAESIKCWGHTVDEDDIKYEAVHQHCNLEDQIYLSESLYVGDFRYDYEVVQTKELNRFQLYNYLEGRFEHRAFYNTTDKDEVTEYRCHGDVMELESGRWNISTCFRAYKRFEGLYDTSMIMVSVDYNDRAAIVKVAASGVSSSNATAIFRHLIEAVEWIP